MCMQLKVPLKFHIFNIQYLSPVKGKETEKKMDWRNVVDVSSFLLFEATGDSEADSDLNMDSVRVDMDVAEDDAESCSWDLSDCTRVIEFDYFDEDDDDLGCVHDDDEDDDDDEEEEEEVISQDWAGGDYKVAPPSKVTASQRKKPRACIDQTTKLMNEMEKNRLFWESCLES